MTYSPAFNAEKKRKNYHGDDFVLNPINHGSGRVQIHRCHLFGKLIYTTPVKIYPCHDSCFKVGEAAGVVEVELLREISLVNGFKQIGRRCVPCRVFAEQGQGWHKGSLAFFKGSLCLFNFSCCHGNVMIVCKGHFDGLFYGKGSVQGQRSRGSSDRIYESCCHKHRQDKKYMYLHRLITSMDN